MTKMDFIKRLAEKRKIKIAEAQRELDAFFDTLVDCLREDKTVKLYGLGRFELKTTKERTGRNQKNGKEYMIPSHKKIKFAASNTLVDKIDTEES